MISDLLSNRCPGGERLLFEFRDRPITSPRPPIDVLEPLEIADGHSANVGEDVRNYWEILIGQSRVGDEGGRLFASNDRDG